MVSTVSTVGTMQSFERDLFECGVPLRAVRALGNRYARALESGSALDWIELYVGIFATLMQDMHWTHAAEPAAAQRILLLVNDDLGTDLFDASARERLALALGGAAA